MSVPALASGFALGLAIGVPVGLLIAVVPITFFCGAAAVRAAKFVNT